MALKASSPVTRPTAVAGAGFKPLGPSRERLIVMVQGRQKTGKSHFALTAPGPIYYQSFNLGLEGMVDRPNQPWDVSDIMLAEYDLTEFPVDGSDIQRAEAAEAIWKRYLANQYEAVEKSNTCVIDFEADAWELFRVARTGRENPEKQSYLSISPEYRRHFNHFIQSDCNLIVLEPMKDEWKNNKATGRDIAAGFKDMPYIAQVIVETAKRGLGAEKEYYLTVKDCRINPDIEGMELPNDFAVLKEAVWAR